MIEDKQRILVIGNGGSGKSTFSKFLGNKLDLEVYHLDKLFWKPNWQRRDRVEWNGILEELVKKDKWIIDGNYDNSIKLRAMRSDLIFFFDYSPVLCLYRIYKRSLLTKLKTERRCDLADGCEEQFPDSEFTKFVWQFNKIYRPRIYSVLEEIKFSKDNLIIFKNRKIFNNYKKQL